MALLPLLSVAAVAAVISISDAPISATSPDTLLNTRHIPHVEISANGPEEVDGALSSLSTTLITARTLQAAHSPSLLPTLQTHVPSLFVTGRGVMGYGLSTGAAGTLKMRGVGGEKSTGVLVLIDGEPMVQGLMGHTLADTYQTMAAQQVEVVRGPASVRYGSDALGGVINIKTHGDDIRGRNASPSNDGTNASSTPAQGGINALNAHLSYGSYRTLSTGMHLSAATRSGFSLVAAASYDRTDGHRPRLDFEQSSAFVKMSQRMGEHWQLALQGYGTHFLSSNPGTTQTPLFDAAADAKRATASLSLRHAYAAAEGSLRAYYSGGDHHIDDGHEADAAPLDYQFRSRDYIVGVNLDETIRPWRGGTLFVGLSVKKHGGEAWNEPLHASHSTGDSHASRATTSHLTPLAENIQSTSSHTASATTLVDTALWTAGIYLCFSQQWGHLTLDGGLRYERYERDASPGSEWTPQAGITWRANRATTAKISVSRGFRTPSLRELYLWASANPDLRAERLVNYEASVERWWCRHRLRTQLTAFTLHASNLIETVYTDGRARNLNTGAQRNRGVEIEAEWAPLRRWQYATQYSYLHTRRPVVAAPRHKWSQQLTYNAPRCSLAATLLYVGRLYTSVESSGSTIGSATASQSYLLLGLTATWHLTSRLDLFARGENLTNRRYETLAGYPMPRAVGFGGISYRFKR
jgi:outer membrane cobalamin receptor